MEQIRRAGFERISKEILSFPEKFGRNIAIIGPRGSGKTRIMESLCWRHKDDIETIYINVRDIVGLPELFASDFVGRIVMESSRKKEEVKGASFPLNIRSLKKNHPFDFKDNRVKDLFFRAIFYPESYGGSNKKIIFLDDFEYIDSLKNFKGFGQIDLEILRSILMQKNSFYVISINAVDKADIFFTPEIEKTLKRWKIFNLKPFSFRLSRELAYSLTGWGDSRFLDDVCLIAEGNPGYIHQIIASLEYDISFDSYDYSHEYFAVIVAETLKKKDGRLYLYLNDIFSSSLSKVRGNTSLISCLKILSHEEGLILKDISERMYRSPQSIKDYLDWLIKSGLVVKKEKSYRIRDTLMKFWILLNSSGNSEISSDDLSDSEFIGRVMREMAKKRRSLKAIRHGTVEAGDDLSLHRSPPRDDELIEFD